MKVGSYTPGMRVYGLIASGQNLAINVLVQPAADGTLRDKTAAGIAVARTLEAVDNSSGPGNARIRLEVY